MAKPTLTALLAGLLILLLIGPPLQAQIPVGASVRRQPATSVSPFGVRAVDSLRKLYLVQMTSDRAAELKAFSVGKEDKKGGSAGAHRSKAPYQPKLTLANSAPLPGARMLDAVCYTQSGRNFLYQDSIMMWTGNPILTADGNVLVSGEYANYSVLPLKTSGGFCMKTDLQGAVIWAKLYDSAVHSGYDFINYFQPLELHDGSILLAGRTDNRFSGNEDFILTKLTGTGNIIWSKTYASRFWQGFNGSGDYFALNDLKEDTATGDIYFVGSHWANGVAVTKVAAADGHVFWSNAYDTYDSEHGFGLIVHSNQLLLFQLCNGYYNQSTVNVTAINKAAGDTVFTRYISQTGDLYSPRLYNTYQVKELINGHYLMSGPTTGYWEYPAFTGAKDLFHAGIIEMDANFNFVKAYGFKNRVESNAYNTRISLLDDGQGLFTMFDYISGYTGEAQICLFQGEQIYHQRKRLHNNEGLPYEPPSLPLADGGYLNIKLMGDSTRLASDGARIDYYRIHTSDTASACLGVKDSANTVWHFNFEPLARNMDSVRRNVFKESRAKTQSTWNFSTRTGPACQVISHCDTVSMTVSSHTVCPGTPVYLTVHKNRECGSAVPLSYDTAWVSGVTKTNDSTYVFQFNNAGQGYVGASIMGCVLKKDSVLIRVLPARYSVDLGPDKSLCRGNTLTLNAGAGFASYLWQDGSTDSTYAVAQPGLYYVTTTNACGGIFKDSVTVTAAPPVPFSAGPDRTKCNDDTLHLNAPSGFLAYTWSNDYNISSLTSQAVVVNPSVDTAYYVKGEKTPGCFAYDTVRIKVYHSPQIDLGPDKSFCLGDSAVFDAGTGFQSYGWSGGQTGQQTVAKAAGTYSVIGASAAGCKSYDTVKVLNVYPLPVVSLDKKSALCFGENRTLNAGSFASYSWNTGAAGSSVVVSAAGQYAVTVTDANGCRGSDTAFITTIHPLPAGFLPLDTAVCSYGTVELKASIAYSNYLWSTGGTSPAIVVSKPGLYWLDVVDANACKGRDTVIVNPKDCMKGFYIPSAFTPNGDGKNDRFQPLLFGRVKAYRFTVYNRWGQAIFQTTDLQKGWDGRAGGLPQQSGVFVWTCTYQFEGEEQKTEKGSVTLIR